MEGLISVLRALVFLFPCSLGLLVPVFNQVRQVFPEKLPAIDDLAVAYVKKIDGERAVFEVVAEDVGVIIEFSGSDALLLLQLMDGGELITQACSGFELLGFGGRHHARGEGPLQFGVAAFEKQLRV